MKRFDTVMLLKSQDGQEYALAIGVPDNKMSYDAKVDIEVERIITAAMDANEDYTFERDIEPALEAAGFIPLNILVGPFWDTHN